MSDLNVGDWVRSTQSGFRGKISSIHHIGDNDWAVLRIPFDEDVTYTARLGELVPCDPIVKPSPKQGKHQPPDLRTERFVNNRRKAGGRTVTVVRRKGAKKITWPEGPPPKSQDRWGWYGMQQRRKPVVVKPKREKFDTADLINEEVRKSAQRRAESSPKRQPILKPRRLVIRPKSDE
tara:strand:+ start:1045 stop:1578 length:534 start_codon:yes stop_codon:yes gene_type:complete